MKPFEKWSDEWRRQRLMQLFAKWKDCSACRLGETRTNVCFGNGSSHADIMLIGEAPGEREDATGNVFVGESGLLLNAIIEAAGLKRRDLFITNLVMCRPPGNRDPMRDERAECFERLYEQIYMIDPMLIMPVGKAAMEALMGGAWKSITALHGQIGYVELPGKVEDKLVYPAMPVLHPAFIAREDKINRETYNWEQGGWAHKTMKDFARARQRVEWLKERYKPARRAVLRVVQ